jgi:hypothetical protein
LKDRMPFGYWNRSALELAIDHPPEAANSASGYIRVSRENKVDYLHRWLWEEFHGPIPVGHRVDHENGKRTDCRLLNLRCGLPVLNYRNMGMRSDNTSGVTGVSFWRAGNAWRASVTDHVTGKHRCKTFSIKKYGDEMAFDMACDARADMIEDMNNQGAGYTARHGK